MMTGSYVAVDIETTGLDPKLDRIIEIGAVRVENRAVTGRFSTLVNPHWKLNETVKALTGITDDDVGQAPGIEAVLGPFLSFTGQLPFLGHNILFDYRFLKQAAARFNFPLSRQGIDTLEAVRRFMPKEEKKNLKAACSWFGVGLTGEHRALTDAVAAHELFQAMEKRFGDDCGRAFTPRPLIYKVKKEQPASKRQKEHLQDLVKYHKIHLTVQMDQLTRSEISRITDKIIAQYGRI